MIAYACTTPITAGDGVVHGDPAAPGATLDGYTLACNDGYYVNGGINRNITDTVVCDSAGNTVGFPVCSRT